MTYREIQAEIPLLSTREIGELLQMITSSLSRSYPGIEKIPGVQGVLLVSFAQGFLFGLWKVYEDKV